MPLIDRFQIDPQGRRYTDVLNDPRIELAAVAAFFDDPDIQRRMMDSEIHHDRPALAGVIREFEARPDVDKFLRTYDAHTTTRFRQAVGVLVKIVMLGLGWRTTGSKGSLGTRAKLLQPSNAPGAYANDSGLSKWFTRAERYAHDPVYSAQS